MTTRRPRTLATVAVAIVALLVACGLPDDRTPRIIAAEDAPLDLSEVLGNVATTTPSGSAEVEIFLVRAGELDPTSRAAQGEDLDAAIGALLAGPTDEERNRGFSSSIPQETELNSATLDGGTAILDLGCTGEAPIDSCGVLALTGPTQLAIFGQLVCTAMEIPEVTGVRFLQDSNPQDAPTESRGTATFPDVVTCDDYASLLRD
jgi:hypothetical protein